MPPPPPPSKSYLIQITDSDLDSECDDDDSNNDDNNKGDDSCWNENLSSSSPDHKGGATDKAMTEQGSGSAEGTTAASKKKRKKKKKKKKKKKSGSNNETTTANTRRVTFGDIRIREFERSFYSDGVPQDGGWPLGFSHCHFADVPDAVKLEDYEAAKQERLQRRWEIVRPGEPLLPTTTSPLETRQWDFKFGIKNPLFRALSEKRRMQLIMGIEEEPKPQQQPQQSPQQQQKQQSPSSSGRRARSNSDASSKKHGGNHHHRRSYRSSSRTEDKDADFEARHIQQELEQLRTLRTKQGSRGCTCRKLHVYIPPPNAGKKAAHRRLNVNKVKEELRKRNALPPPPQGSREDLERLLADLVQKEPCCGPECECSLNGIGCQSDACSCWKASNNHLKESTQAPSPQEIKRRCGNTFGMYAYDEAKIEAYRRPFFTTTTYCQPVAATNGEAGAVELHAATAEEKKIEYGS